MNEAETKAELIDPKLKEDGWDSRSNPDVKVHREFPITAGKIRATGGRGTALKADYILSYKSRLIAVVEAKSDERPVGEGVAQAKNYADKLKLPHSYAANGKEIYHIEMETGKGVLCPLSIALTNFGQGHILHSIPGSPNSMQSSQKTKEEQWVAGSIRR